MEQKNIKQDSIIFDIEKLLSKMSNQVNFLIRKEIQINQLDVDLLMENTRKLYDAICSIELGMNNEELRVQEEDSELELVDSLTEEFEEVNEPEEPEVFDETEVDETETFERFEVFEEEVDTEDKIEDSEEVEEQIDDAEIIEDDKIEDDDNSADMIWDFTRDDEEPGIDDNVEYEPEPEFEIEPEPEFETELEPEPEAEPEADIESEYESNDKKDVVPSPITNIYSAQREEDSGIKTYRIVRENAPTISDMLEQNVDNSLAARLQRKPVADLISAIGINDKFLFLNELFGGSMEKYNKSIRSLNSFSTLLGAKTYMSELQIEFQWNCESEAYKKLADLIERRFIPTHNA